MDIMNMLGKKFVLQVALLDIMNMLDKKVKR